MSLRYLSMTQLSEVTGLDRRTVKHRLADVKPFRIEGKAIIYDAHAVLAILLGFEKYDAQETDKSLLEEQLRYEKARADKVELEVEKLRSEVVPIEDVAKAVADEYTNVRARLMSIGSRLAIDVAPELTPNQAKDFIDREVNEALAELTADIKYTETINYEQLPSDELTEVDTSEDPQAATET